jgi:hypothetical protein
MGDAALQAVAELVPTMRESVALVLLSAAASACGASTPRSSAASNDPWTYPIHLGDSRTKAHDLLGSPKRATDVLEEFPKSGVTLWFNTEGKVAKVNLQGVAGALYTGPSSMLADNWIPSDRTLVFGLGASSTGEAFLKTLGPPLDETNGGAAARREIRRVWRREGYVVDATFLGAPRSEGPRTFPTGALLWVEASHGQ